MDGRETAKQAACINCRRSKLKCFRDDGVTTCTKCQQRGVDCIIPEYRVGRHKGVKNKKSGLEKAIHQIERAIKDSASSEASPEGLQRASNLQTLLGRSQYLPGARADPSTCDLASVTRVSQSSLAPRAISTHNSPGISPSQHSRALETTTDAEGLTLDDAENPLQLLARTSELLADQHLTSKTPIVSRFTSSSSRDDSSKHGIKENGLQAFFGRFKPRLDLDRNSDPIDIGLLTMPEAEILFTYFYENLAHTRWGLDPITNTPNFVRSRSNFLFTSVLAASARFLPSTAALFKRLQIHAQKLAHSVMENRYRSVEIVLAFMVNIPWLPPGEHWADDETSSYLAMALTIALDLSLDKIVIPSPSGSPDVNLEGIARSDCIDSHKALALDGFCEVDPLSDWGRRLLRRRERAWFSLFALERGVCLARGRNYTLPMTPLVETCDHWHVSEIADTWDGSIVSVVVLRRDLVCSFYLAGLIAKIRAICDGHSTSEIGSSLVLDISIKKEIESFFERWYITWPFQIGDRERYKLPPYVEILACHTRLSMYSSVINHPTAPVDVKHFFRAAGLSSALNVLRAAVQGESQLKSMPNNTAIMISFAACFALGVSTVTDGNRSSLAPSVRTLIAETADVLERIGGTPDHRKGVSALFAQQLRKIGSLAPQSSTQNQQAIRSVNGQAESVAIFQGTAAPNTHNSNHFPLGNFSVSLPSESFPFSGMSNDEIDAVINNAGVGLEALWDDFQFDESTGLDWLDWPTVQAP